MATNKIENSPKITPVSEPQETDFDPSREDESKRYEKSLAAHEEQKHHGKKVELDEIDSAEAMKHVTKIVVENSEVEPVKTDETLKEELDKQLLRSKLRNIR